MGGGGENGLGWLLQNHRTLIDAEYCVNPDAGGGVIKDGKHILNELQTAEKVYLSLRPEVKNRAIGHDVLDFHARELLTFGKAQERP